MGTSMKTRTQFQAIIEHVAGSSQRKRTWAR
jgi:hypothetical protein